MFPRCAASAEVAAKSPYETTRYRHEPRESEKETGKEKNRETNRICGSCFRERDYRLRTWRTFIVPTSSGLNKKAHLYSPRVNEDLCDFAAGSARGPKFETALDRVSSRNSPLPRSHPSSAGRVVSLKKKNKEGGKIEGLRWTDAVG